MPQLVAFPARPLAPLRSVAPPSEITRAELGRLIDGLTILAVTRPAAVIAVKEIVLGLLAVSDPIPPAM